MAQTPAKLIYGGGDILDHTFGADAVAGDMIVVGNAVLPVVRDVDYVVNPLGAVYNDGVFDIPKANEAIGEGAVVYWDADGNPYGGTAGSGAATHTSSGNKVAGTCVKPAAATDQYVRIALLGTNQVGT
jgi:predicted RecA/RadA family phage recombinase